jgi:diacylglycerol O-acyltransferase / wax synthase
MLGLGPVFDGMGLINTIYSYVDEIVISFTCDRKMMPDPALYADCLHQSFADMKASVAKKANAAMKVPVSKPKSAPKIAAAKPAKIKPKSVKGKA